MKLNAPTRAILIPLAEVLTVGALTASAWGDVPLFPPFDRRWFADPGAISVGFPASPHSRSSSSYFDRNGDWAYSTQLVLLPHPTPSVSDASYSLSIQQFRLALLTTTRARATFWTDELALLWDDYGFELESSAAFLPYALGTAGEIEARRRLSSSEIPSNPLR